MISDRSDKRNTCMMMKYSLTSLLWYGRKVQGLGFLAETSAAQGRAEKPGCPGRPAPNRPAPELRSSRICTTPAGFRGRASLHGMSSSIHLIAHVLAGERRIRQVL